MYFYRTFYMLLIAICVLSSCQEDVIQETPIPNNIKELIISEDITEDVTWAADKIVTLEKAIHVTEQATLTIEPGTIVKSSMLTPIIISKGSKIMAEGTASQPIIFTSHLDSIQPGQIVSPNLTEDDKGHWPGIFILGCAPLSSDPAAPVNNWGLPEDSLHVMGGDMPMDDSGILRYVSIRHAGSEMVEDEETNSLNLGAVGSNTIIDHVETYACIDDGISIQGGTVNVTNLIVHGYTDDGLDVDYGWQGNLNNFIAIGRDECDEGMELDGGEGELNPSYTITNFAIRGQGHDGYAHIKNGLCTVSNGYFFDFNEDAKYELEDSISAANWVNQMIDVANIQFNTVVAIDSIFVDNSVNGDAFVVRPPDAVTVSSPSTGADKNEFLSWSLADAINELADF